MGYWDAHPMAGDAPMDGLDEIESKLFSEQEMDEGLHRNNEEYAKRLAPRLAEIAELSYLKERNLDFVLPFKVAELGIRIENEVLSHKIKSMIKDGGAADRGYADRGKSDEENHYSDLQSPYDYARALYDNWDKAMRGEIDLTDFAEAVGLTGKFLNKEPGSGLINLP